MHEMSGATIGPPVKAWGALLLGALLALLAARADAATYAPPPAQLTLSYFADLGGTRSLADILAGGAVEFQTAASFHRPNDSRIPVWIRLQLKFSPDARGQPYRLVAANQIITEVRAYRQDPAGAYRETVTGNRYPVSTREFNVWYYAFVVDAERAEQTLYLRVLAPGGVNPLKWYVLPEPYVTGNALTFLGLSSFMLGGVVVVAFINFATFAWLRERKFIFYALYLGMASFGIANFYGFNFWVLWPEHPGLNARATLTVNLATALLRLQVITLFLSLDRVTPRLPQWNRAAYALLGVGIVLGATVGSDRLPPFALSLLWAAAIFYGFGLSVLGVRRKLPLSRPLLVALLIPSAAAFVQGYFVSHENYNYEHGLVAQAGVFIHAMLFVSLVFVSQVRQEMHLRERAEHDSLTGLPGTNRLRERFEQVRALATRNRQKVALLFIDADGFKPVNDTYGHAIGDKVLQTMAIRISQALRASDAACRLGGDEFVVMLGGVADAAGAARFARRLLDSIATPYTTDAGMIHLGASIGVVICPDHGESFETLLHRADEAMYQVKRSGKNAVSIYNPDLDSSVDGDSIVAS